MNRMIGIVSATLLALVFLVPMVSAADFGDRTERFVIAGGTDVTLGATQSVDVFVVYNGHARIEGTARAIFVVNGSAELVGGHAAGIVAIRSQVTIDAASAVSGDIRTFDSTVATAPGAALTGRIRDLGPDIATNWFGIGTVLFFVYLAFAISAIAAGVVLAGIAGRQIRAASTAIRREPVQVVGAGVIGFVGLITAAILAIITVVGIPFGLGLLVLVLPALWMAGYLVTGIWIGEVVLGRSGSSTERRRPYLAAVVGLTILGVVSIVPMVGGLISLLGFGAVMLLMWRAVRGGGEAEPRRTPSQVASAAS